VSGTVAGSRAAPAITGVCQAFAPAISRPVIRRGSFHLRLAWFCILFGAAFTALVKRLEFCYPYIAMSEQGNLYVGN